METVNLSFHIFCLNVTSMYAENLHSKCSLYTKKYIDDNVIMISVKINIQSMPVN